MLDRYLQIEEREQGGGGARERGSLTDTQRVGEQVCLGAAWSLVDDRQVGGRRPRQRSVLCLLSQPRAREHIEDTEEQQEEVEEPARPWSCRGHAQMPVGITRGGGVPLRKRAPQ